MLDRCALPLLGSPKLRVATWDPSLSQAGRLSMLSNGVTNSRTPRIVISWYPIIDLMAFLCRSQDILLKIFFYSSHSSLLSIWLHPPASSCPSLRIELITRSFSITNEVRKLAKNHKNLMIRLVNFRFLKTWENFQNFVATSGCLKKIRLPYWKCLGGTGEHFSLRRTNWGHFRLTSNRWGNRLKRPLIEEPRDVNFAFIGRNWNLVAEWTYKDPSTKWSLL